MGDPAPTYQWNLNGQAIAGATSATYTTPPTTLLMLGQSYTVTVANPAGTVTSSAATLTVDVPTTLTTQPQGQTLIAGSPLALTVGAAGYPSNFTYQWTLNNQPIVGATLPAYYVAKVGPADAGVYQVVVSNGIGNPVTSATASVVVQQAYPVNGTVLQGAAGLPGVNLSINAPAQLSTTSDASGNFVFPAVPQGTYLVTPSTPAQPALFSPTSATITVGTGPVTVPAFQRVGQGYNLSGTIAYAGAANGNIYLSLSDNFTDSSLGTMLTAPGPFTIRGLKPGVRYYLRAYLDVTGHGEQNANDPTGWGDGQFIVTTSNQTGATVTLEDPEGNQPAAPTFKDVFPMDGGAVLSYKVPLNAFLEANTSYTLEWSTDPAFGTLTGTKTFPARGETEQTHVFVSGLTHGTNYMFRMRGNLGAASSPNSPSATVTAGPVQGGHTLSGTFTFPGTATGPLYIAASNLGTGAIFSTAVPTPVSGGAFSISGLPSGVYNLDGLLDQDGDGLKSLGDLTNLTNGPTQTLTVAGDLPGQTLNLSSVASTVSIETVLYSTDAHTYRLRVDGHNGTKKIVALALVSGPNRLVPEDLSGTQTRGFYGSLGVTQPTVGDAYGFLVTYSDGSSETISAEVTGVLAAPANLKPTGTLGFGAGTATAPVFSWSMPSGAPVGTYTYYFKIDTHYLSSNPQDIWSLPGLTSPSATVSLAWGVDPANANNQPTIPSLVPGTTYGWQVIVHDQFGNGAASFTRYTPQ